MVLREALKCNPGELTGLVNIPGGWHAVAATWKNDSRLIRHLAGHPLELTGYIRKRRDELVFNEWQNYLVAKAEIHNLKSDAEMAELDRASGGRRRSRG